MKVKALVHSMKITSLAGEHRIIQNGTRNNFEELRVS